MTKKTKPGSGSSYSLIALLKRTLFLHETATTDELAEEVHEYMLKDQSLELTRERYVKPLLKGNPSFAELEEGSDVWKLTEGNKVNDAIYEMFKTQRTLLSERQVLNRLAKSEHFDKLNMALNLKDDPRFSDIDSGKFWMLSEWVVINEYARSILLRLKGGLTEKELIEKAVEQYDIDPESAIFLPQLDERFMKKDKKWTLKKYVEHKTTLRPARIERLYQYLHKMDIALSEDELTKSVLDMPASATDVHEKLTIDPRFVLLDGKWDLRERVEQRERVVATEKERVEREGPAIEPIPAELAGMPEFPEAGEEAMPVPEEIEMRPPETVTAQPEVFPQEEFAEGLEEAKAPEEAEELEEVDREVEQLHNKVIEFLQTAFHLENIVYNPDIIDQFVTFEDRAEFFEQFSLEHFPNPSKNRELTDTDLIKFLIYLAEPTLNDKIIDPCCGTGGFLIQMLKTLRDHLHQASWEEKEAIIQYTLRTGQFYFITLTPEERQTLQLPIDETNARQLPIERFCRQQQLTGIDIDEYAYKTADLNLAVCKFPEIVLHHDNALTSKQIGSGVYDMVIGNPSTNEDNPTRFLRRSLLLAKPGGKILLLLPYTMFDDFRLISSSLRNQIVAQTIVKAVLEFPEPYNERAYGPQRTLLYCTKKHHETEQHTDILVGRIPDFDGLRDVIEVLEEPDAPVSQSDEPIPTDLVSFVLSSYQGSAYTLLLEGLRRQALHGELRSIQDWVQVRKDEELLEEQE